MDREYIGFRSKRFIEKKIRSEKGELINERITGIGREGSNGV